MSNAPEVFTTTDIPESLGPSLWGLEPYQIVSISMVVLIAIFVWKKVPGMITGGLDAKIASIREQLDEAKKLRAEAEALRDEYSTKIANAEKDAEAMIENARHEAEALVEKAEADSKALIERRKRMAEDKIAAAERDAIDEVRATAARAAATASRKLIAEKHDASADISLTDKVIAGI
ncbi:F0F1 ATP synthase subunit B family protein [Parerythrobacter jejuensis]